MKKAKFPEPLLQTLNKKPFKIDLTELHGICDANYARLLRVFPDYENSNARQMLVGPASV